MNIDKFASINNVKRKTVEKWINDGLIPRANLEGDYIPDSARPPFTKARAKNANAIYVSMVKAAFNRKHILPVLYNICEDEFNAYIDNLVAAGCIERRTSDEVTYYDATIQASNINKEHILNMVRSAARGISEGITTTVLNRIGA
ncbi:MAG: hypothetical protein KH352_07340 [Ruminococcus sp.]|nr:hypothetical protein [Candidatus Apopatosoma intestinale]